MKADLKKPENDKYQKSRLKEMFAKLGYDVIFTPPYCPTLQPIELVWASVKNRVRDWLYNKRSMQETRKHILQGFYGRPEKNWPEITKENCENLITKVVTKECPKFVALDDKLSGAVGVDLRLIDVEGRCRCRRACR